MRRKEEQELRRLEQALLEADMPEEEEPEEDPREWADQFPELFAEEPEKVSGFTVRNTDAVDVDLDSYSEEVYRAKSGGCLIPGLITAAALGLLAVMVLWLMNYLGVMG